MSITTRRAVREDMVQIMKMIQELADYEDISDGPKITYQDLERDGFDSNPPFFFCILAEFEKSIIGYVMCNFAYSSWTGRAMYMEDFYVESSWRGKRVGHKLFKEMCKCASENGCHRLDWHTLVANKKAVHFYESHGGYDVCKEEKRTCYRLNRDEIVSMANSED